MHLSKIRPKVSSLTRTLWVLLLGLPALSIQALDSGLPPGGNFNLTNWYLGLPVDSSGGTTGVSASISAAQLTAGYSNALYFYSGADGAMVFWAPVTGATTGGSDNPRSELREQITPPSNDINWIPYGNHILSAQCRVTQVPSTFKVIIGQIHCKTGNARPLVKLQYNNGVIEALIKTNSNFDPDYKFTFQNVGLSNLITYGIQIENGLITTTVNGSNRTINVFDTDPDWATNGLYFKAGSYCQDNTGTTNEGSRVAFYALSRGHAPSITNAPGSRTVQAGTNTTFNVSAVGNGALRYQWLFNTTNLLGNATNAELTLLNVQPADAGGYSVKVTDDLGAVTSSVASLVVTGVLGIVSQPGNQIVGSGSNATFSVTATGTAPFGYQWQKGGTNLTDDGHVSGSVSNVLLLTAVTSGDVGNYRVVVTNSFGSVTSTVATLTVTNANPIAGVLVTNVIVDDSFADGNRANTGPFQADWWSSSSSSGNSVEAYPGQLGLISGSSGRGLHGTFTPQTLGIGDTIRATYTFTTPLYVTNSPGLSSSLRVAMMDFNDAGLAADLTSSTTFTNVLYTNLPGYMSDFDVNYAGANTAIRKHTTPNPTGRFLGTTAEWDDLGNSPSTNYTFTPNTEYVGVFSITRTESDGVDIYSSLSQGGVLMDGYTASDSVEIANHYGMLGFWVNSRTFGTTTTPGEFEDNGITFSNIKVEVVTYSTAAPTLNIARAGSEVVLSWLTAGSTGYSLKSAPSLTPVTWSSNGPPPVVVGDSYVVTNTMTGSQKYYRLANP